LPTHHEVHEEHEGTLSRSLNFLTFVFFVVESFLTEFNLRGTNR